MDDTTYSAQASSRCQRESHGSRTENSNISRWGLYKLTKQLQMAREDMNHIILSPGELHVVIGQQRYIGAYIENSVLDICRTDADL